MQTQLELFEAPADPSRAGGMRVAPWRGLRPWLVEVDRQLRLMRPSTQLYARFNAHARLLTAERLRTSRDAAAVEEAACRLDEARGGAGLVFHDLDRVWTRAELGTLLVEARNRARLLALGRHAPKPKGPALDPRKLPDDRLEALIQTHRDVQVVDALRAERLRRARVQRGEEGRRASERA